MIAPAQTLLEEEMWRTSRELGRARHYLGSEDFDSEYRKAVARQMAGLLREDSRQRLDEIAARSDDPDLQRTVAECKQGVDRATRYIITMFREARDLQLDEVRKAQAEARETLDHLKNPPVD